MGGGVAEVQKMQYRNVSGDIPYITWRKSLNGQTARKMANQRDVIIIHESIRR